MWIRKFLAAVFLIMLLWRLRGLGQMVALNGLHVGLVTAVFQPQTSAKPVDTPTAITSSLQARVLAQLDLAQAEMWLEQGVEGNGRSLTFFELCRLYWQEGRVEEAITACQSGHIPGTYWINLGLAATQTNQLEEVLAYYQMAAATDPTLPQAWQQLGSILIRFERYQDGIAALKKALALNHPPDPLTYLLLGRAYKQIGELEQSHMFLNQGIEKFPDVEGLYVELAEIYGRENDWTTVEGLYGQLTTHNPDNASAWARRANNALRLEQAHDAVTYYRQAVTLSPSTTSYQMGLAEAAIVLEDWQTAVEAYETVIQLENTDPQILLKIGDFFRQISQNQRAMDIYNQILFLDPTNAEVIGRLEELNKSP